MAAPQPVALRRKPAAVAVAPEDRGGVRDAEAPMLGSGLLLEARGPLVAALLVISPSPRSRQLG
jgi:hypothetical protein